jgi:hypothetical protein
VLDARVRAVLDAHWRALPASRGGGFTVPNAATYPHQWLWDSCFHAVIWAHLGEADRAIGELSALFAHQGDDGFVPHLTYWGAPDRHAALWGRRWTSTVTQPPMYGHAVAELCRRGIAVPGDLVDRAVAGLRFLLVERSWDGLPVIVHPWESGCDDSPRWDAWYASGRWTPAGAFAAKGRWVQELRLGPAGSPVGSEGFEVPSVAFAALVGFNASELASVRSLPTEVTERSAAVAEGLAAAWEPGCRTFADGGPRPSAVRTVEAQLPVLVVPDGPTVDGAFAQLHDPSAFAAACGPAQVHRAEPAFDPMAYWRGPAWPQLSYLLWLAARRRGRAGDAGALRDATVRGALRSGFAEHWHPDTGEGLGAAPQSWTGLAAVMAAAP